MSNQKQPYEADEYVQLWLTGLSERTRKNYTVEFANWLNFVGMTPKEQIEKRLKDTSSTNMEQRAFFENKFRAYRENLELRRMRKTSLILKSHTLVLTVQSLL